MAYKKDIVRKDDGSYLFTDFSRGLYLLDTPRNFGEQLGSLALTGGRNIWSEKGALVNQHGYQKRGEVKEILDNEGTKSTEVITAVSKSTTGVNTLFVTTLSGKVFIYTAREGIKLYKTLLSDSLLNPIVARRGKDLVAYNENALYLFGSYYDESEVVEITASATIEVFGGLTHITVPELDLQYYWVGKDIIVNDTDHMQIESITKEGIIIARAVGAQTVTDGTYSVGEKCKIEVSLTFQPDNTGVTPPKPDVTLVPTYLAVSNNRLYVAHTDGNIYYSVIGNINNFQESAGAGYFGGFYNDTSKILCIEEFLEGTLITKENGIYYLTIGDSVTLKKISQVGQVYETDHVIVGEKVYAYDTNSGAVVNAVGVNVFGSLVSGKPIIDSEELDAINQGIDGSRRCLTYNAESEVFILYFGNNLERGIVLTKLGTLFPRELDLLMNTFIGFNQGVVGFADNGLIIQDFKKGTVIPDLSAVATFEPIGLRDNRLICSTLVEVTELNGINYEFSTINSGFSTQVITPSFNIGVDADLLPPLIYSEDNNLVDSFELTSKWAEKSANVTRIAAPMSGRDGISLTFEFPANNAFCLSAIRLPDFSQGA